MKKLLVVVLAMAIAVSFGSMAMAKDGLSVDLGFAMNFNGADMGKSIVKDGEDGAKWSGTRVNGNTVYKGAVLGKAIMPENQLLIASKDVNKKNVIASVSEGGAMQGLNTALRVRYDFLNAFFARLGFVYDMQIMGGETSYKFGPMANVALGTAIAPTSPGNFNVATALSGLANAKVTQTWTYGYWGIPLTIGVNVPINDGKYNIYAGLGLTYYSGYWQIEMKVPEGYSATVIIEDDGTVTSATANPAGTEKAKFEISGLGFNYTIGASAEVAAAVSIFVEWDATIAAGMSDNVKLKSVTGKEAFGADNVFYPVNLSTSLLRFGVNYRLPIAL